MNDFFLLNNESLPYVFIDQNIVIKQIQIKNLNQFAYFADPIKQLESYSIETIKPIILTSIIQIMGLCSLVTSLDPETFSKHIEDQDAIADLILKIIQVNEDFFKKDELPKRPTQQKTESASWFYSFQYLISCGHGTWETNRIPVFINRLIRSLFGILFLSILFYSFRLYCGLFSCFLPLRIQIAP